MRIGELVRGVLIVRDVQRDSAHVAHQPGGTQEVGHLGRRMPGGVPAVEVDPRVDAADVVHGGAEVSGSVVERSARRGERDAVGLEDHDLAHVGGVAQSIADARRPFGVGLRVQPPGGVIAAVAVGESVHGNGDRRVLIAGLGGEVRDAVPHLVDGVDLGGEPVGRRLGGQPRRGVRLGSAGRGLCRGLRRLRLVRGDDPRVHRGGSRREGLEQGGHQRSDDGDAGQERDGEHDRSRDQDRPRYPAPSTRAVRSPHPRDFSRGLERCGRAPKGTEPTR